MGITAIFANSGIPFWIDVAVYLRDKYEWNIPYFIGADTTRKIVLKKFPKAVFHTNSQAKKNIPPIECSGIHLPSLDQELLTSFLYHESIILKLLDRSDYRGSYTYKKRILFYHSQLSYWMGVINYYKPDVVVFRTAPHAGFDYILYAVCDVFGVRTIMFEKTAMLGRILPVNSFREGSNELRLCYERRIAEFNSGGSKLIKLSENTKEHISTLKQSYKKAMPFLLKYKIKNHKNKGELDALTITLIKIIKDIIIGVFIKKTRPNYLERKYFSHIGTIKKRKLLKHYNRLAEDVDLSKPFIFAALQCEPERQAVPCGGIFGNQYLMIDMLSKNVPNGWKIYVKEHISQFKSYQAADRGRSIEFYNYINSLHNVKFVPLSYSSFDLIDNAIASATVSGSVGWESVVRGKPALLFGYAWYKDCEGISVTHNLSQLKSVLNEILNGYCVDKDKVAIFASSLEEVSFKGAIDVAFERAGIISYDENVNNFGEAIHRCYTRFD
jgi:hypothetical protein